MAYLISRYFGLRSFGAIYGFIFGAFALAGGLGAYIMGSAFDARGSYELMLVLLSIATFIGAALMMRLGPYRYKIRSPGESGPELEMLASESQGQVYAPPRD